MIKTRLVGLLSHAKKYIVYTILWQWVALLSQVLAVFSIADLLERVIYQSVTAAVVERTIITLILVVVVRFICERMGAKSSYLACVDVKRILREKIYEKMLKLGVSYKEQVSSSEVVQVSTEGVEQLETYFGKYLPQLFYSLIAPLTLFAILCRVSIKASVVLLICVPLIPISIVVVQKIAKKLLNKYWSIYTGLGDSFLENLQGLTTLKIYQADQQKADEMDVESQNFRRITMKVLTMQLNSTSVMDIVAYGGAAVGMAVALSEFLKGNISISGTICIVLLASEFFLPLRLLGSFFHIAMNGMAASDKIFKILDLPEPQTGDKNLPDDSLDISFKNVHFAYEENREILKGIDLYLPAGSFVSLVGESGCGKSTIAGIISATNRGFTGEITIGGVSLSEVSESDLMKHVVLVRHNSYLFKGTIEENLRMVKPDATEEEMNTVLKKVNLLGFLQTQGNDKELTEAIKKISFEDISVYEIEIIGKYIEAIGEGEWFNKRYEGLMAGAREFQHALVSKELGQSEERLIALLIAIFGVETSEKVEICREYSKIIAVLNYMESGISDIRWLGRDLQRKHSQEFVKLICITVDLDLEQLKKELYSLSHFGDKNSSFVSYDHTVHLHLKGEWSRCRGEVSAELLEEALSSHSGILGVCACYMAYYNIDKPDIVELLVKLFRASAEDRIVKRVGIVLKAGGYKELEVDAEERLIDDSILSFPCLFDYLSKIPDIENGHADRWLSCIEHGLAGNRYLVISALKYVLSLRKESISENIRTQLESMIKGSYNKWKKKKIRCLHCKEEVFIKPNGFCPKCSVGTELPTKYFIEALVSFSSFTMEEYIHLCSHPMSDVSAIAKRELQKIWIAAPNKLEYVIDNFEKLEYDGCIFELILHLPSQITCPYGIALKRLGMEISEEMQLIWLGTLRSLEWISAECMKTMVCESLSDESDAIRNKAMKCWLGEKDFWWENFA